MTVMIGSLRSYYFRSSERLYSSFHVLQEIGDLGAGEWLQ